MRIYTDRYEMGVCFVCGENKSGAYFIVPGPLGADDAKTLHVRCLDLCFDAENNSLKQDLLPRPEKKKLGRPKSDKRSDLDYD